MPELESVPGSQTIKSTSLEIPPLGSTPKRWLRETPERVVLRRLVSEGNDDVFVGETHFSDGTKEVVAVKTVNFSGPKDPLDTDGEQEYKALTEPLIASSLRRKYEELFDEEAPLLHYRVFNDKREKTRVLVENSSGKSHLPVTEYQTLVMMEAIPSTFQSFRSQEGYKFFNKGEDYGIFEQEEAYKRTVVEALKILVASEAVGIRNPDFKSDAVFYDPASKKVLYIDWDTVRKGVGKHALYKNPREEQAQLTAIKRVLKTLYIPPSEELLGSSFYDMSIPSIALLVGEVIRTIEVQLKLNSSEKLSELTPDYCLELFKHWAKGYSEEKETVGQFRRDFPCYTDKIPETPPEEKDLVDTAIGWEKKHKEEICQLSEEYPSRPFYRLFRGFCVPNVGSIQNHALLLEELAKIVTPLPSEQELLDSMDVLFTHPLVNEFRQEVQEDEWMMKQLKKQCESKREEWEKSEKDK